METLKFTSFAVRKIGEAMREQEISYLPQERVNFPTRRSGIFQNLAHFGAKKFYSAPESKRTLTQVAFEAPGGL